MRTHKRDHDEPPGSLGVFKGGRVGLSCPPALNTNNNNQNPKPTWKCPGVLFRKIR